MGGPPQIGFAQDFGAGGPGGLGKAGAKYTSTTINLTTTDVPTLPIRVMPGQTNFDVIVHADTWSTAVVEPQVSLTIDNDEDWVTLAGSFEISASRRYRFGVPVPAGSFVRLKTTTAASGASVVARVKMRTR